MPTTTPNKKTRHHAHVSFLIAVMHLGKRETKGQTRTKRRITLMAPVTRDRKSKTKLQRKGGRKPAEGQLAFLPISGAVVRSKRKSGRCPQAGYTRGRASEPISGSGCREVLGVCHRLRRGAPAPCPDSGTSHALGEEKK